MAALLTVKPSDEAEAEAREPKKPSGKEEAESEMNWLEAIYLGAIIVAGFCVVYRASRRHRQAAVRGFDVTPADKDEHRS